MLRIVASAEFDSLLVSLGVAPGLRKTLLRHGEVRKRDGAYDLLLDRNGVLPPPLFNALNAAPEVTYIAQWALNAPADEATVLKGVAPTDHKFFGWPV